MPSNRPKVIGSFSYARYYMPDQAGTWLWNTAGPRPAPLWMEVGAYPEAITGKGPGLAGTQSADNLLAIGKAPSRVVRDSRTLRETGPEQGRLAKLREG
ncbi:MAG TPA: hypothetical protein VFP92_08215 [Rhodanobacteraceae bacterium]|nr:hypothetical protein [Rhodanobacteraceae bacterium]